MIKNDMISKRGFGVRTWFARRFGLGRRETVILVVLVAVIGILALLGETVQLLLRYERDSVMSGELWRLLTAHLVHLSVSHAALNLTGLVMVGVLFFAELKLSRWLLVTLISAAAVDIGYLLDTSVQWYVGLSGVLHGIVFVGGLCWAKRGLWEGYVFAVFVAAKLIWEQTSGALPVSTELTGGPVAVDSHLYGVIGAGLAYLFVWLVDRKSKRV